MAVFSVKNSYIALFFAVFAAFFASCFKNNERIEKITVINGAVPVYKFTIPEGDSISNYAAFSAEFMVDSENYYKLSRVRAYGVYPYELFTDLGNIVFLNFDGGSTDKNGPYLLSNIVGSNQNINFISNNSGPHTWFTLYFPLTGMRHARYNEENFPAGNARGDFYFALGMGTSSSSVDFTYYVKNIVLANEDNSKKIFTNGSGFNKPAFAGYIANISDIHRVAVNSKDIITKDFEYDPAQYYHVREIYPWLYSIYDPQNVFCYLAVGEDRALLFDTGHGIGNLPAAIKQITDKPVDIVLGHGHSDHVNGAYQFHDAWIHEDDYNLCLITTTADSRRSILSGLINNKTILPRGFNPVLYISAGAGNIKKLTPGQVFDLGGLVMEVIPMEGHTAGSIGLFAREHHVLLNSDSASSHIWLIFNESLSLRRYAAMLERVLQLDFHTSFCGHSDLPLPKSYFQKFLNVARNASVKNSQPYQPDRNTLSYQEDGMMIAFTEDKLAE